MLRHVRRALAGLGVAALVWLLWSIWDHEAIVAMKRSADPLPFFGAAAVLPTFGVPLTPFFIVAGASFSVPKALAGSLAALAVNLSLCHWIARSALRPRIEALFHRVGYKLPNFEKAEGGALRFTVMVKLAPGLPSFVKNYILGLAGAPFGIYLGVSMAVSGLYAAVLIVLGDSLFDHDLKRVGLIVAVVLVLVAGVWWWRRQRLSDAEA